ncbi:hypothetical protein [Microcella sp.]|uniref:hypothetical protein n=1 Tax=Microcella sp. TaxID=1913979 RepID=UPI003919DAF3
MTTIKKFQSLCPRDQIALLDPGATFTTVIDFRGQGREVVTTSAKAKTMDMPIIRRIARQDNLLVYTSATAVRVARPAASKTTNAGPDDASGAPRLADEH